MTRAPYRVAIVGLNIGRSHLFEGYSRLGRDFTVVALCDIDPARLATVGDEFGVTRRVTSFDEVLAMADVDIVDICTPPALHQGQIIAALKAGKHVICEKPLVGSLAQVDEIAAVEAASPGRVMPIFQYRWGNGFQKAKLLVDRGIAGKPYAATCETHWRRGAAYYDVPWRGTLKTEMGGVLLSHAIHLHDMMCQLMGPAQRVYAEATTRVNPIETEDCVAASLSMASGAVVTLSCTLGAAAESSRLKACFEHVMIESSLTPYSPGNDPWTFTAMSDAAQARIDAALADFTPVEPRFLGQLGAYAGALDGTAPWPVTVAEARASLELITAFYHSAAHHEAVTLPIGASHSRYRDWRVDAG